MISQNASKAKVPLELALAPVSGARLAWPLPWPWEVCTHTITNSMTVDFICSNQTVCVMTVSGLLHVYRVSRKAETDASSSLLLHVNRNKAHKSTFLVAMQAAFSPVSVCSAPALEGPKEQAMLAALTRSRGSLPSSATSMSNLLCQTLAADWYFPPQTNLPAS